MLSLQILTQDATGGWRFSGGADDVVRLCSGHAMLEYRDGRHATIETVPLLHPRGGPIVKALRSRRSEREQPGP